MSETPAVYVPPVIEHSEWNAGDERLVLFTITKPAPTEEDPGAVKSTDYTIPNKPHAGLGLLFLRMARMQGYEIAQSWLLDEVVGFEGMNALAAEPDLEPATLRAIFDKVRRTVLGGLNSPKA